MQRGTCKHFNGTFHNNCCDAGVNYDSVTTDPMNLTGKALRIPCHTHPFPNASITQLSHHRRRGSCEKYEEPTAADIAEHEADIKRMVDRMTKTMPLVCRIKEEHQGQEWAGIEACPICGGKLHLTHAAFNGHVWGKCETTDCVSWME